MKMLSDVLMIFLLCVFNLFGVQASHKQRVTHGDKHIRPHHRRCPSGNNFGNKLNIDFHRKKSTDLISCRICGLANERQLKYMIVGGKTVKPAYKYPWMVNIRSLNTRKNTLCDGAILNEYYILTAAHCFIKGDEEELYKHPNKKLEYMSPKEITVSFMTKTYDVKPGPSVKKIIPHPAFSYAEGKHDICLLKLSRRLTCSRFRNPICLPSSNFRVRAGKIFTITGWGTKRDKSAKTSKVLKEAKMKIVNFNKCAGKDRKYKKKYSYCLVGTGDQSPCDEEKDAHVADSRMAYMAHEADSYKSQEAETNSTQLLFFQMKNFGLAHTHRTVFHISQQTIYKYDAPPFPPDTGNPFGTYLYRVYLKCFNKVRGKIVLTKTNKKCNETLGRK